MAAINGTFGEGPASGVLGNKGIGNGILGFTVAEVGIGGRPKSSGVRPGINKATTFWMSWAFYDGDISVAKGRKTWLTSMRSQFGGGASATMCMTS